MVKYRHLIPKVDDILDELHGSCVFLKLIWKVDIIILGWKNMMNGKLHLRLRMVCMSGKSCLLDLQMHLVHLCDWWIMCCVCS
jgi:hypothetical protein